MSLFNDLINGKGADNYSWTVTKFIGDEDFIYVDSVPTYAEALSVKVNHKESKELIIELWDRDMQGLSNWIGDETDWADLQSKL